MSELNEATKFFQQLERRVQLLSPKGDLGIGRDVLLLVVMGLGLVLALVPFEVVFSRDTDAWITLVGLLLQLVSLALISYRQVRGVAPEFVDAKWKFAKEMDEGFIHRQDLLAWMRKFSEEERIARVTYVDARLESMRSRYPIVFGIADKVGFLPVLVGVFVQLLAMEAVSLPMMVLGVFIVVLYAMSIWMVRFRLQMEAYARLLRATIDSPKSAQPT